MLLNEGAAYSARDATSLGIYPPSCVEIDMANVFITSYGNTNETSNLQAPTRDGQRQRRQRRRWSTRTPHEPKMKKKTTAKIWVR